MAYNTTHFTCMLNMYTLNRSRFIITEKLYSVQNKSYSLIEKEKQRQRMSSRPTVGVRCSNIRQRQVLCSLFDTHIHWNRKDECLSCLFILSLWYLCCKCHCIATNKSTNHHLLRWSVVHQVVAPLDEVFLLVFCWLENVFLATEALLESLLLSRSETSVLTTHSVHDL